MAVNIDWIGRTITQLSISFAFVHIATNQLAQLTYSEEFISYEKLTSNMIQFNNRVEIFRVGKLWE